MQVCLSFLNRYLGTGHQILSPCCGVGCSNFSYRWGSSGCFMMRHSDSGLKIATNTNDEESTARLTQRDIFKTIFRLADEFPFLSYMSMGLRQAELRYYQTMIKL